MITKDFSDMSKSVAMCCVKSASGMSGTMRRMSYNLNLIEPNSHKQTEDTSTPRNYLCLFLLLVPAEFTLNESLVKSSFRLLPHHIWKGFPCLKSVKFNHSAAECFICTIETQRTTQSTDQKIPDHMITA